MRGQRAERKNGQEGITKDKKKMFRLMDTSL